jgi:hypothetical protein
MLWVVLMFVVFIGALIVFSRMWMLMFRPPLDHIHANDTITRLRLDE